KGQIRLSLVTTQTVPKNPNGQEDPNRAIRFEGTPTIAADKNEAPIKVLVPANLSQQPYDLALRAELLGGKGEVLATAVTEVLRMEPGPPFALELAGKPEIEIKPGSDAKLNVKVNRYGDFSKAVTLNLTFIDSALEMKFVVPPNQTLFELPVGFTAGAKA